MEYRYISTYCRYSIHTLDGYFSTAINQPIGWTHIVLNYIEPNNGQGIRIYHDSILTGSDDTMQVSNYSTGDGRVVVGRQETNNDFGYIGVDVDELLFFNEKLSDQEIPEVKNMG